MSEDKNNPFSVRMEPEDKEKLLKLIQESGSSSNKDFMNVLMSAYVLNKVKVEVPEASESIKKVEELTQLINDYFVNMSKQIKTSKEALNLQFTKDLDIYKSKVDSLKDENSKMDEELDSLRKIYNSTCNDNADMEKQVVQLIESLKDKTSLVEEYRDKNDMLTGMLKKYEKYPEEVEQYKSLLADNQAKNIEINNLLNVKIEELKKSGQELELLNQKHLDEINKIKDQAEFHKEKVLLDKEKEHQAIINKINAENNEKVRELLHENQEYNSKFSKLMEESQEKTGEINRLNGVIEKIVAEDFEKTNKINELREEIERLKTQGKVKKG